MGSQANSLCTGDAFQSYVGVAYAQSDIYATGYPPSEETWEENDDREIICILHNQDDSDITGSLRGANR